MATLIIMNTRVFRFLLTALLLFFSTQSTVVANPDQKQVSGWVEKVAVGNPPIILRAKIDTGAKHSSIHAPDVELFTKGSAEWVRFSVKNVDGDTLKIEQPVKRITQIKQKGNRPNRKRPVIELGICMGNVYKLAEVNLADRGNFNYPMLVGRSFLQGSFVVDSDQKFILQANCKQP